jgi:putative FmdB family regulatory protein
MPRYIYKCEKCGIIYQIAHSIKEKLTDCEECGSENTLKRIPTMPLVLNKTEGSQKQETGTLVKEYIEGAREDLKNEKKELSSQVYKDG